MKSSLLKLKRAKQHLDSLESVVTEYRSSHPNALSPQYDISTDQTSWVVVIGEDIKDEIALLLGDIIHNGRSSLDLLANDHLTDAGLTPTRNTYYPFAENAAQMQDRLTRTGLIGLAGQSLSYFLTNPPSKDRNPVLYSLHALDIVDKHRTITPVTSFVEIDHLVVTAQSAPLAFRKMRMPLDNGRCFLVAYLAGFKIPTSAVQASQYSRCLTMILDSTGIMFSPMKRIAS
jgi:hypothetical protein